jgi:hypothetical protein
MKPFEPSVKEYMPVDRHKGPEKLSALILAPEDRKRASPRGEIRASV